MYLDEHIRDIVVNEPQVLEFPKLTGDSIVNNVVESFIERSNVGFAKYGTNLDRKDLSFLDWLNHLQMELLDAANYAEKLLQREEDLIQLVKNYPNDQELGSVIRQKYG